MANIIYQNNEHVYGFFEREIAIGYKIFHTMKF